MRRGICGNNSLRDAKTTANAQHTFFFEIAFDVLLFVVGNEKPLPSPA